MVIWLRLGWYLTSNLSPPTPPPHREPFYIQEDLYLYIYIFNDCCSFHVAHNPLLGYRTALQGVGFFKGETAVATLLESINGNNLEEHKVKFDAKDAIRFMRCISKSHICQLAFPARSQSKLSEKHIPFSAFSDLLFKASRAAFALHRNCIDDLCH